MEVWKEAVGFEGLYEVSNLGRVRSVDRTVPHQRLGTQFVAGRVLKQESCRGYLRVTLSENGKFQRLQVHRLVAEAFHENPSNRPHVHHIDHDKVNNRADNLLWVTPRENIAAAKRAGRTHALDNPNRATKLTAGCVRQIRALLKTDLTQQQIANRFGITQAIVSKIKLGKIWSSGKSGLVS